MAACRRQKSVLALLAMVALLVRFAAALLCHMPQSGLQAAIVDPILGAIEVCTSHGLQPLTDAGESDSRKLPPKPDPCPACALAHLVALAMVLAFVWLGLPLVSRGGWGIRTLAPLVLQLLSGANRSRAPPLPA